MGLVGDQRDQLTAGVAAAPRRIIGVASGIGSTSMLSCRFALETVTEREARGVHE